MYERRHCTIHALTWTSFPVSCQLKKTLSKKDSVEAGFKSQEMGVFLKVDHLKAKSKNKLINKLISKTK